MCDNVHLITLPYDRCLYYRSSLTIVVVAVIIYCREYPEIKA
jgi:hypothetical protein